MTEQERQELESQLAALKRAKRSGALSVQHGDKRVQYRSMNDLQFAIEEIEGELGTKKRRKMYYMNARRGY